VDIAHEQLCIIAEPSDGDFADFSETDGIKDICCPEEVFIEQGKDEEDWDGGSSEGQEVHDPELSWSNRKNQIVYRWHYVPAVDQAPRHLRDLIDELGGMSDLSSDQGTLNTTETHDLKLNECAHDYQCLYPQGI